MPSRSQEVIGRIQHELARRGFDPGGIDGIDGPRTRAAVRAFQASAGLLQDGIVGPKTYAALFGAVAMPPAADNPGIPWFQEARRLIGVREKAGPGNNQTILDWAADADIDYPGDDVAWCGLFAAHCISATLRDEPLPGNPLGARNWQRFGAPCTEQLGAIIVFWREAPIGPFGHVGFYAGQDPTAYHVLGGNQGDAVTITRIAKARKLALRWPATAPLVQGGPLLLAAGETFFSTNEA
jgi:uncharacterized protein (TIGR02594 family)